MPENSLSRSRFQFDHDFSAPKGPSLEDQIAELTRSTVPLARHEEMMKDAEHRGYERGYEDGRQSEEAKAANAVAAESAQIAETAQTIIRIMDEDRRKLAVDCAKLSYVIASKLAGHLIEEHPTSLIEEFIAENLSALNEKPTLQLAVSPAIAERLEPAIQQIAADAGYAGRLVLQAKEDAASGDCLLSWADGSIGRQISEIDSGIQQRIGRYFSAEAGPEPQAADGGAAGTGT